MVSNGTVVNDTYSLRCYLENYLSIINGIGDSWKGPSNESLVSQAESFVSEYNEIITQMNNFANACSEYERYKKIKTAITETENERATVQNPDQTSFNNTLSQLSDMSNDSREKIVKYLTDACTPTLSAQPLNNIPSFAIKKDSKDSKANSSKTDSSKTDSSKTKSSDSSIAATNKAFIDSILSEEGKTISDYPSFYSEWCAQFVSEMLVKNGYDVERSAIAGYVDENSIFKCLRRSGATIHLDLASRNHDGGGEGNPEYDPNYSPQPGDVVLYDFENDGLTDHVGFVIKDNGDGTIQTIEGNTYGPAGSSCVAIHDAQDRASVFGYATPVKKSSDKSNK